MFTRYLSSPLLGVVDVYLMLGSLPDMCLVRGLFDLYLVLESLPGIYGWVADQ